VLLYLASNKALTWTATQVPARFSTFNESQLRSRIPHCIYIDRIANVATAMADEDANSGFGDSGLVVMIGIILQSAQFVLGSALYILVSRSVYTST